MQIVPIRIVAWGLAVAIGGGVGAAQGAGAASPLRAAAVPVRINTAASGGVVSGGTAPDGAKAAPSGGNVPFDVTIIKPSDPAECCARTWEMRGMRFSTRNTSLRWLIRFAYELNDKQVVGGPAWMDRDRYDVTGGFDGPRRPTEPQCRTALQDLLASRFQLRFHHQSRVMPAYVLSVARGGPKLTRSDPKKDTQQLLSFSGSVGQTMHGYGRDITLRDFIGDIQRLVLDRPLVDDTGITGKYDISLVFTREDPAALAMTQLPDNAAPNLLTALDEQLGLKLKVRKVAVDVLAIDSVKPPSPN